MHNKIPQVILAVCILHNFVLIRHADEDEDDIEDINDIHDNNEDNYIHDNVNNSGALKRDFIVTLLY